MLFRRRGVVCGVEGDVGADGRRIGIGEVDMVSRGTRGRKRHKLADKCRKATKVFGMRNGRGLSNHFKSSWIFQLIC